MENITSFFWRRKVIFLQCPPLVCSIEEKSRVNGTACTSALPSVFRWVGLSTFTTGSKKAPRRCYEWQDGKHRVLFMVVLTLLLLGLEPHWCEPKRGCSPCRVGKAGAACPVSRSHSLALHWACGCVLAIPSSAQPLFFSSSSRGSREGQQTSPSPLMRTSSRGSWLPSWRIKTGKHPQSAWFCSVPCIMYVCSLPAIYYHLILCNVLTHTYPSPPKKSTGHKKLHRTWQRLWDPQPPWVFMNVVLNDMM